MKKATVVIQARMGSSRLPDKVLMPLAGKSVLEHVIRRCQHAQFVDRVIVATTVEPKDMAVVNFVNGLEVAVFCGSVNDVLDRYYQTARRFESQHIIRITADCPMIDPDVIDRVVGKYFESNADYASNTLEETFPDGEDVEIFSLEALSMAWQDAKLSSEREHVTPYIRKNDIFEKINIRHDENWGHYRWTLDEFRDYQKLSFVFDALYQRDPFFHMNDIVQFLQDHPEVDGMNVSIGRNEGYQKSLANDKKAL